MGIWAEVRGPARGVFLLLQCRATKDGHKGERIQPHNTKPQGIKLHHSQRSSLGGKCRRRLSLGGSQYITKYIKDSFMSPLLSFTGYLCGTNAKGQCCYCPRVFCTHCTLCCCCPENPALLLFQNPEWLPTKSSHLGLLE